MARHSDLWLQKTEAKQVAKLSTLGVSPNFEITVACGVSLVFEDFKFKISEGGLGPKLKFSCLCPVGCLS